MLRLFFALQPSAELGARLLETASPLCAALKSPPVPAGNLHATLCFIGAVASERLEALRATASQVRASPVELEFDIFEF